MPRLKPRNSAMIITITLVVWALYKVNFYKSSDTSSGTPILERIHVDADVIANSLPSVTPAPELAYREIDESMMRYERMSTCNSTALSVRSTLDELNYPNSDPEIWEWIQNRIRQSWERWKLARMTLERRGELTGFTRKRVLILPGVLKGTNFARRRTIYSGGPLGELLQWADLIAGLYVLGHHVTLEHDTRVASLRLLELITDSPECQNDYDIIYLDRASISALPVEVKKAYRCRFRVLDVFGTQAMFSDPVYKETHRLQGAPEAEFLELKQYYTFYPQTPDNTFLGFVVSQSSGRTEPQKENIAVLYGKDARYLKGKEHYISLLSKYVDVHYTMPRTLHLATEGRLYNDAVLTPADYAALLDKAKIVVGLGHPIEGTGAMEALAHGCVFFNPKYLGSAQNIFKTHGKPTHRLITSQIPYLEQYIGPPHVYTINTDNDTEVITSVKEAIHKETYPPFIPDEFSTTGYLHRLSVLVERQNFCSQRRNTVWPPLTSLLAIESGQGQSCSTACDAKGLVCEPVYFFKINDEGYFRRMNITCQRLRANADLIHPSVTDDGIEQVCTLQENSRLFSCEGARSGYRRICPCRSYKKYQVALPGW